MAEHHNVLRMNLNVEIQIFFIHTHVLADAMKFGIQIQIKSVFAIRCVFSIQTVAKIFSQSVCQKSVKLLIWSGWAMGNARVMAMDLANITLLNACGMAATAV